MADGKTHDKITQVISFTFPLVVGTTYLLENKNLAFEMTGLAFLGCQLQRLSTPDLDVDAGYYGFHLSQRYFGIFFGIFWKCIWWPYAKLVPHRSWISHGFIIGSIIRISYIYYVYFLITRLKPELFIPIMLENIHYFLIFFIGFMTCDFAHILLDLKGNYAKLSRRPNTKIYNRKYKVRSGRKGISGFISTLFRSDKEGETTNPMGSTGSGEQPDLEITYANDSS